MREDTYELCYNSACLSLGQNDIETAQEKLKKAEGKLERLRRRGGLMVSALDSGSSGPSSSAGWGHCVVFLGKILYSHSASLHPGV